MKIKGLVNMFAAASLVWAAALPAHAQEQQPTPPPNDDDDGFVEDIVEDSLLLALGAVALVGVGIYLLTRDDSDKQSRLIDEYNRGLGLRLNDPDSAARISLLPARQNWPHEQGAFNFGTGTGPRLVGNPADEGVEVLRFSFDLD